MKALLTCALLLATSPGWAGSPEAARASLYDLHETEQISYEDALRNADSVNDIRLNIKLNSKLYGGVAGIHKGIEHMGLTG